MKKLKGKKMLDFVTSTSTKPTDTKAEKYAKLL